MSNLKNETDLRLWYEQRRGQSDAKRDSWSRLEHRWTWVLLASLVFTIAIWFLNVPNLVSVVGSGAALALFVFGLRRNRLALTQREAAERERSILNESLKRVGGQVQTVRSAERPEDDPDSDEHLLRPCPDHTVWELTAQERDDFDFYAKPVGLFGLLNRTSTGNGARRLRDMLERPLLLPESITARQECVRWLAENDEQRVTLMAALAALRREDERFTRLLAAIAQTEEAAKPVPSFALRIWSLISIVSALAMATALVTGTYWIGGLLMGLLVVNLIIDQRYRAESREFLAHWRNLAWSVQGFDTAVNAMHNLPEQSHLQLIRIACETIREPKVLTRLRSWQGWSEANGFIWELVHAFSFSQTLVAHNIRSTVLPHREALRRAAGAIAELDALCSLACFAAEQPHRCWPELADSGLLIEDGIHPLLEPQRAIPNTAQLDPQERIWLISGSNMAGKSTFLRMIGTNALLAQLGTIATATVLRHEPLRLISDLQARDNLSASESYFLAEVRHVRRMVAPPAGTQPVLGLLDEPFRGTNSDDQSAASVAVVEHLHTGGGYFLIASHDKNLPSLARDNAIRNFHFRENLGDSELVFDYRLHDGPALTRNALRVLEFENYPETLVKRAHEWLRSQGRPDGQVEADVPPPAPRAV